jgi:enamine deaminase RidA (YjgF/YER057c/UK114 family)
MMLYMSDSSVNSPVSVPVAPTTLTPPAAKYAHAMLTTTPQRWLHTSGVVPTANDGSTPNDLADQAALVWANIGEMLAAVGMNAANIVSITTYVVAGHPLAAVMAARDTFLSGHIAASTLITVPALAKPEWQMEIAIIAAA